MQAEILHQPRWTQTALGTPIELYRKGHTGSPTMIFVGGVHGDEPEGVYLALELLNWLKSAEKSETPLRNWILIPNFNPDGSAKSQRTNGRGVDLNRNFPSSDWNGESKALRYFPGPTPASEPEIQALCTLLNQEKLDLIVHFHSWEPSIVYTGPAGKPWAELLAASSGYSAKEDIGYPTPGSLGQYGAFSLKVPVICVEAQEKSDLKTLWPKFGPGLQRMMKEDPS